MRRYVVAATREEIDAASRGPITWDVACYRGFIERGWQEVRIDALAHHPRRVHKPRRVGRSPSAPTNPGSVPEPLRRNPAPSGRGRPAWGRRVAALVTSIDIVAVPRGVDAVISHLRHPIRLRPGVDLVWTTNGIVPAFWDWRPEPERERIRDVGIFQQRRFAARADRIVVWTEHGADHLVSLGGVDAERIRVVPPIMQLADAVGPPFERTDAVRFAYVGAAAELKGLPEAIRAVTATPGAELVVVGWPPMDSFSVPTTGPIRFLGPLSPERVAQLLDDADCLLVPAHQETFGVTYVEAMKHGLPVISTSLGTTTEIVGNAGVLVPPGDVDALTDAVRAMTADSALRRDTAQRARERFATLWAPDVVAPRWESVLR